MDQVISEATRRNWERLNTESTSRLTKRANKRMSVRKIVPLEYFSNKNNRNAVEKILSVADDQSFSINDILCSVAENLFAGRGILNKANVQKVLSEYPYKRIDTVINSKLPEDEQDLLGIIYQSAMLEGTKNKSGSYYTPFNVTSLMMSSFSFSNGQTFFDPCCGSGAFLLSAECDDPEQLFGMDCDPTAVMIAEFNMLLHYPDKDFTPNIICGNFLQDNPYSKYLFDNIATNPPWGAFIGKTADIAEISSNETFSLFFVKAYQQLKKNGTIRFLLPESVLNVKVHKDIRNFILKNCCLDSITIYDSSFSGVVTGFVDIECRKCKKNNTVRINNGNSSFDVDINVFSENKNRIFCFLTPADNEIITHCRNVGKYDLRDSRWALGIVTGDNKGKLKPVPTPGSEAVYTGKEIVPYGLKAPKNYVFYDRNSFQQTAGDEYYRAPEKLVYKFISSRPVFAYDDGQCLFLNSANILIPDIEGMNIKTVMAFLNSELFSFLYKKMFGELKMLKGNLMQLPFPEISSDQDKRISSLVNSIISGESDSDKILQDEIFSIFGLSAEQSEYIRKNISDL